jgi:crotonobetainyl-CoA:carnitine CoA-transferase CaiB-like acyl-CoA transferase
LENFIMLPLNGVRILAVEQYGAGPIGTQYLVDMGAEVIKIENPRDGGDISRSVGPFFLDDMSECSASIFYQGLNHNKKSITIDLTKEGGKQILHRLVENVDAIVGNLRGDVPEKLGLTYDHLKAFNPKLVCGHISAYGRTGERASWPGYDYMMQAEAGFFSLTGEPDTPPTRFGLSIVDFMSGLALACATVAALLEARQTGKGRDVDVSLFDVALYNLNYIAHWQLNAGHNQQRLPRSAHASLTPCQLYTTKDGWIYVMCNKEKFWRILCEKIERSDLVNDPRYATFAKRYDVRDELTAVLDDVFSKKTTCEWISVFEGKVPVAPVYDVSQAMENPFVTESGRIWNISRDGETDFKILGSPMNFGADRLDLKMSPSLGEHTNSLLRDIGFDEGAIRDLELSGVI